MPLTLAFVMAPAALAQQALLTISGTEAGGWLGESIAGMGDVNGDGVPDLAVGVPRSDQGGLDAGRV